MESLKEWAKYYYSKGIYSYPSELDFNWTKDWRGKDLSLEQVESYNWKTGIHGVAGSKGIRVLELNNLQNRTESFKHEMIKKALHLLGLSKYPWIIYRPNKISFVVNCFNNTNETKQIFGEAAILWEYPFSLPCTESISKFYFRGIPTIKPEPVDRDVLIKCAEQLGEELIDQRTFWTLQEFVEKFGKMRVLVHTESNGNTSLVECTFTDSKGTITTTYIADVLKKYTPSQLKANRDRISVRILDSGAYCLCLEWEEIEL